VEVPGAVTSQTRQEKLRFVTGNSVSGEPEAAGGADVAVAEGPRLGGDALGRPAPAGVCRMQVRIQELAGCRPTAYCCNATGSGLLRG
jgi:hypothetical protein